MAQNVPRLTAFVLSGKDVAQAVGQVQGHGLIDFDLESMAMPGQLERCRAGLRMWHSTVQSARCSRVRAVCGGLTRCCPGQTGRQQRRALKRLWLLISSGSSAVKHIFNANQLTLQNPTLTQTEQILGTFDNISNG